MATLYEYYNTDDDAARGFYGADWRGQTFTPSISHKITEVKLKLYRTYSLGIITFIIRATSGGLPTGGNLCSGTLDGNDVAVGPPGAWATITLGAGANLLAGVQYALIVDNHLSSVHVFWRSDETSGAYSGGNFIYSGNSGASWGGVSTVDMMFEEWGEPLYKPGTRTAHMAAKMMAAGVI